MVVVVEVNENVYRADRDHAPIDDNTNVSIRCPHCGENGAFHNPLHRSLRYFKQTGSNTVSQHFASVLICPNTKCKGLVFVVRDGSGSVKLLPPARIDFDSTSIPQKLLATLVEAISCHSVAAYKATSIMVRRLLEEICDHEGAAGPNLHARLQALRTKVTLSGSLLDGAMELKILGNDAAHIEAKEYESIGQEEAEVAIEVVKEILKALYQHKSLVQRMQNLKKTSK